MRNFVQGLESRTFLSVSPGFPGHFAPKPPDAAITADLAAIKTAEATLATAWKADGATIIADQKALGAAIKTARANVPSKLTTQLTTDQGTFQTDLMTLFKDYRSHAGAIQITADKLALTTAQAMVQADIKAIQTSINTDASVVAAQKKLTTDSATVTADEAAVQGAFAKLYTDLKDHA